MKKGEMQELRELVVKFRDARNWKQFHNPKDMSLSLVLLSISLFAYSRE